MNLFSSVDISFRDLCFSFTYLMIRIVCEIQKTFIFIFVIPDYLKHFFHIATGIVIETKN